MTSFQPCLCELQDLMWRQQLLSVVRSFIKTNKLIYSGNKKTLHSLCVMLYLHTCGLCAIKGRAAVMHALITSSPAASVWLEEAQHKQTPSLLSAAECKAWEQESIQKPSDATSIPVCDSPGRDGRNGGRGRGQVPCGFTVIWGLFFTSHLWTLLLPCWEIWKHSLICIKLCVTGGVSCYSKPDWGFFSFPAFFFSSVISFLNFTSSSGHQSRCRGQSLKWAH